MVENELRSHLDGAPDWDRMKTDVEGVFVVKMPPTDNDPARLMVEVNPVDKNGRPKKRKGLYLPATLTLSEYSGALKVPKLDELLKAIDEVNANPDLQNRLRLAHSLTVKGGDRGAKQIPGQKMLKGDIYLYKIHNMNLFEFVEAVTEEQAASERVDELQAEGYDDDYYIVIKVKRSKFKNKDPFDKSGTCYALYRLVG